MGLAVLVADRPAPPPSLFHRENDVVADWCVALVNGKPYMQDTQDTVPEIPTRRGTREARSSG